MNLLVTNAQQSIYFVLPMLLKYKSLLFLFGFLLVGEISQGQDTLPVSEQTVVSDTVLFHFAPKKRMFWADYKGNKAAILSLTQQIRAKLSSISAGTIKVRVLGFCSSYDSFQENLAAAKNRSNQVKSYFIVHEGLKEENFRTTNSTRPWRGKSDIIAVAYLFEPDNAINSTQEHTDASSPKGETGTGAKTETPIAPSPLTQEQSAEALTPQPAIETPTEPETPIKEEEPSELKPETTAPTTETQITPTRSFQWAIKTNVAYLAATVANLGVEFAFGEHYSINVPFIYSPYTVADNYKLRFLAIQPEFRYWLDTPMKGHFFGVHLHGGFFNIAVDDKNRYQSPDGFYGIGLSYGYKLPFNQHWGAEFSIGAGYVHTKYNVYYNIPNGAKHTDGIPYNYWGLTNVEIGLVYTFGK